ncbi:MAG: C40 family peptidase [Syntrophomonadales bacterium]
MRRKIIAVVLSLTILVGLGGIVAPQPVSATSASQHIARYKANMAAYKKHEQPIVDAFWKNYRGTLGQKLIKRAIWYMENGYMVYGHSNYAKDGKIDCSNFVSLIYKDFGFDITTRARDYNKVGRKVSGVYSRKQPGSSNKYELVGVNKLWVGDILLFWNKDSKGNRYISHVALYMGKFNGKPCIIHTVSGRPTAIGITNSFTWWYGEHFQEARRIFPVKRYKARDPIIPAKYQLPPQNPVVYP